MNQIEYKRRTEPLSTKEEHRRFIQEKLLEFLSAGGTIEQCPTKVASGCECLQVDKENE